MVSHWSRCVNLAGRPAGLRFHCPDCGFTVPYSAPTTITHCGKPETFSKSWWEKLPVYDMRQNWPRAGNSWGGEPRVVGDRIVVEV
jgi:hypothetical protein